MKKYLVFPFLLSVFILVSLSPQGNAAGAKFDWSKVASVQGMPLVILPYGADHVDIDNAFNVLVDSNDIFQSVNTADHKKQFNTEASRILKRSPVVAILRHNQLALIPQNLTSGAKMSFLNLRGEAALRRIVVSPQLVTQLQRLDAADIGLITSALNLLFDHKRPFPSESFPVIPSPLLALAQQRLYSVSWGSPDSGDAQKARLTIKDRTAFILSPEFKNWVKWEKAQGKQVFWLKDLDKTQAAGDIFTFFFLWRAENGKITPQQNEVIKSFLKTVQVNDPALREELSHANQNDARTNALLVIKLWRNKEKGGEGIAMLEFWSKVYWPTQIGLSREEKLREVAEFAPHYASKIYPWVPEENLALRKIGIEVVIVSNGDQELAKAVAPLLGIKKSNVVGSHLLYKEGIATGVNHSYEIFDKDWTPRPQPGKSHSFHFWVNNNKRRWGWRTLDLNRIILAGIDGDSASSDGGMMINLLPGAALGNFMIDTPHEPNRLQKFYALVKKYGWSLGQYFTLSHDPSSPADWND